MANKKKVHVRHNNGVDEVEADSIEQALKHVAKQVKNGDLQAPFTLAFDGPAGSHFAVTVDNNEQAQEISTMGFMF